jgi:A/G-specific adenine glycosylase
LKRVKYAAIIEGERLRGFQDRLLTWFKEAGRDLPWRRTRDPYAILVSEILLHQTTVQVVAPVYERFLREFPTVRDLAAADLERVKAITDPLGYKVRGRWLKAIAEAVVQDFDGRVPDQLDDLMRLPGVGRYTAGAVLAFAFGTPAGVLDTNVARIMARFFAITAPPGADRLHRLWALAEAVVPAQDPWSFNQGLMDLGAEVCRARKPLCLVCPVADLCPVGLGQGSTAAEHADGVGVVFWVKPRTGRAREDAPSDAVMDAP